MNLPKNAVSAERVRWLVAKQVALHGSKDEPGNTVMPSGLMNVSSLTGLSEKTIRYMTRGQSKWWTVSTLDIFLTKLDLEHLTYLPAKEGGFADVYDSMTAPKPRKYYYPDREPRKKPCSCGKLMDFKSKICKECDLKQRAERKVKCVDCNAPLLGGHRRTKTPRCIKCWNIYRKDKPAPAASKKALNRRAVGRKGYGG